jgi:hypothetical protein
MVPLAARYHNEDLQPGNQKHWPQEKLQSMFNAIALAE